MEPIPITLRQIDYVIATAEEGSTAAAARLLSFSQPSVSMAIAKAEEHFGRPLFVRVSGPRCHPNFVRTAQTWRVQNIAFANWSRSECGWF